MELTVFKGVIDSEAPFLSKFNGTVVQWYADYMEVSKGGLAVPIKGLNKDFPEAVTTVLLSEILVEGCNLVDVTFFITEQDRIATAIKNLPNVIYLKEYTSKED